MDVTMNMPSKIDLLSPEATHFLWEKRLSSLREALLLAEEDCLATCLLRVLNYFEPPQLSVTASEAESQHFPEMKLARLVGHHTRCGSVRTRTLHGGKGSRWQAVSSSVCRFLQRTMQQLTGRTFHKGDTQLLSDQTGSGPSLWPARAASID